MRKVLFYWIESDIALHHSRFSSFSRVYKINLKQKYTLKEIKKEDRANLYYCRSNTGQTLLKNIKDYQIDLLNRNPDNRLYFDFKFEPITTTGIEEIRTALSKLSIDIHKMIFIVQDALQEEFLLSEFSDLGITSESIFIYPRHYINGRLFLKPVNSDSYTHKKFTMLIRRHEDWRLLLLLELEKNGVLDDCNFTYQVLNYDKGIRPVEEVKEEARRLYPNSEVAEKLPVKLHKADNGSDHNTIFVREFLRKGDFNIVVETLFDQSIATDGKEYLKGLVPSMMSEKIFKVLSSGSPFIAFSTPYFLEDLRKLGFKTFAPAINEEYDTIEDNEARLHAIVSEAKRIANLPEDEYSSVVKACQAIADENRQIFIDQMISMKYLSPRFKNDD